MIRVFNLSTQEERYYTCPPVEAVVCAYEQARGNANTWQYDFKTHPMLAFGQSGKTVFCGDWGALL